VSLGRLRLLPTKGPVQGVDCGCDAEATTENGERDLQCGIDYLLIDQFMRHRKNQNVTITRLATTPQFTITGPVAGFWGITRVVQYRRPCRDFMQLPAVSSKINKSQGWLTICHSSRKKPGGLEDYKDIKECLVEIDLIGTYNTMCQCEPPIITLESWEHTGNTTPAIL
jgi:hypothetical protein